MRRWGYGLAGFLAIAFIAGLANPDESPTPEISVQAEQSQSPSTAQQSPEATPEESLEPEYQSSSEPEAAASSTTTATAEPETTATVAAPEPETNRFEVLLSELTIADEYPSGYDRDLFRHWVDVDGDGCNARREVLILEAIEAPVVGANCELIGGLWYSVYDGITTTEDGDFDIDHMIPLKEAWDSGAYAWDADRRRAFANDLDLPEALIAVTAGSNRSKSDRDPADWLPPLTSYHCQYVEDWMAVKIKWDLSVDAREFAALRSVAAGC